MFTTEQKKLHLPRPKVVGVCHARPADSMGDDPVRSCRATVPTCLGVRLAGIGACSMFECSPAAGKEPLSMQKRADPVPYPFPRHSTCIRSRQPSDVIKMHLTGRESRCLRQMRLRRRTEYHTVCNSCSSGGPFRFHQAINNNLHSRCPNSKLPIHLSILYGLCTAVLCTAVLRTVIPIRVEI